MMEPLKEVGGVRTAFIRELAHKEKGDLRHQVVKPPSSQSFYIDLFSFVSCSGINVKVVTGGGGGVDLVDWFYNIWEYLIIL